MGYIYFVFLIQFLSIDKKIDTFLLPKPNQNQNQNQTKMDSRLKHRLNRLYSIMDVTPLEKYYGLETNSNEKITFSVLSVNTEEKEIILTISFTQTPSIYNFENLPLEVIRDITSYNYHFVHLKIKIKFPDGYPFIAPVWNLLEIRNKLNTHVNVKEYYEYIIENHNRQNSNNWTPITYIEKDILMFLLRINHFEYFTENV